MLDASNKIERKLSHDLSSRQVTMISIAGIVGAGLFVGSAAAISKIGPAVILSYILTGILVLLVMRMLGEMAVARPDSGSFSTYAAHAIGPWAGFSIGWLYWWFWVLIIPVEAIAGADILHLWFASVPSWFFTAVIMTLMTITNLASVKNYGEFEYWFALIKVFAIVTFIVAATCALLGFWPFTHGGHLEFAIHAGGFMPHGFGAVLTGMLITIFSFFGAEIVTIAAGETERPADKIRRATNLIVYRIAFFYVFSISLIVSIVPWTDPRLIEVGSFQRALELMNVPAAKFVVDAVVLVAVTSCLNSGLYTASRMLYSLSSRRDAPRMFSKTSDNGVPRMAVLASTLAGFVGCFLNYLAPGQVFSFLLSTTGAIALLVYLVIAVSQLCMRKKIERSGGALEFKMWLYPYLTWAVIGLIIIVLGYMVFSPEYRFETLMTLTVVVLILGMALFRKHFGYDSVATGSVQP
ncbi:TPA: amino acid permease [Burkholderia vietnamiensis]|nr:amino acid permease [Burkholderia vietnamiensis]